MSTSLCRRCLALTLRPSPSAVTPFLSIAGRASFSTSTSLLVNPPKKKATVAGASKARAGKTLKLSKKTRVASGRPPAPGERKALRKKLVLSNPNAIKISDLKELKGGNLNSSVLHKEYGQVLAFTPETVDALRSLEAFKPTQKWGLFRRPTTLIRSDTIALAKTIEACEQKHETSRRVLCGEMGSGKSVLQLQAMALAHAKGWLVIHIPEAQDLVNAQTSYQPITAKNGETLYIQPHATAKILGNMLNANRGLLRKMQLSHTPDFPTPVQENMTLDRFVELGAKDPALAWPVWKAFWREMRTPSKTHDPALKRPPVLFSLDALHHVMQFSAYLDAEANPVHAHDLVLVRRFKDLLSGFSKLPNGGLILGATSKSNQPYNPTLKFWLDRRLAQHAVEKAQSPAEKKELQKQVPTIDPYAAFDPRLQEVMERVQVNKVTGLSKREARGILEYYARSGMLRAEVTSTLVGEKWAVAGGGIVGKMEKATVGAMF